MPPFVGRKRSRTPDEAGDPPSKKKKKASKGKKLITEKKSKRIGDTESKDARASVRANEKFLEQLSSSSSEESASDVESDDFEDVLPSQKRKAEHEVSDGEINWEDALPSNVPSEPTQASSGDLELTLNKSNNFETLALTDGTKKGPSKIERQIRINTHKVHVLFLMAHNLVRNGWSCDTKAQEILVNQLPANLSERVQGFRAASGLAGVIPEESSSTSKQKEKRDKGKRRQEPRKHRDWGNQAVRQENGVPDTSHGDPLPRLLKELVVYWKRTFRITEPGLRKQGYKPISTLQEEITSFHNDPHDSEKHGERIRGRSEFRRCAKTMEGSRDIGAQLFVCLLRGLGIETRLVANLQPVGFGWGKAEEAKLEKSKQRVMNSDDELSFSSEDESAMHMSDWSQTTTPAGSTVQTPQTTISTPSTPKVATPKVVSRSPATSSKPVLRQPTRGAKDQPINLDSDEHVSVESSSSELSDAQSVASGASLELIEPNPAPRRKPNASFDRSLAFPNTWVEAISPVSYRVFPIDPVVTHTVATREEDLVAFEPRGKKAERGKQVMAYVLAFNSDGTAKEVTTRYLKRHQWPGRTKGMRITAEKVPVYNRRGKVKRYEQYDWFKTVLSGYARPTDQRTPVDDLEEATDLKPLQIAKKAVTKPVEEIDTLAGYKASADFVLERHLRRDEALLPYAEPVRYFTPTTASKGAKGTTKASAAPEAVYRRADVVAVKTAESWHKEGREIMAGAQPLKTSKIRAVTLQRQREVETATRLHGVAPTQGLYSREQTDWIIPPPIRNGVIPKNAYGSMDVFVSSMIPEGAAHVPWRGAMKAAKKIGCDYAEAVTGFDFGNRRAIPVIEGVIVAAEHEAAMIEEIQRAEEEKRIKEEGKRAKVALGMWRKFVMGLRIIERVRDEYGPETHGAEERNPFLTRKAKEQEVPTSTTQTAKSSKAAPAAAPAAKKNTKKKKDSQVGNDGGGFLIQEEEDVDEEAEGGGGFLIEEPTADSPEDEGQDEEVDAEEEQEQEQEDDDDEDEDEESDLTDDDEGSDYTG